MRSFRLVGLVGLWIALFAPHALTEESTERTVRLQWEPGHFGTVPTGRVPLRAQPVKGVKLPSAGKASLLHARIKMAESKGLAMALDPNIDDPRIWVDRDFDSDLHREKVYRFAPSRGAWERPITVMAPYKDDPVPVALPLVFRFSMKNGEPNLTVRCPMHRRGSVVLGGRVRFVALTDGNYDMCLNDPKRDSILIDLDGDRRITMRGALSERVKAGEPFRIGQEGWTATVPRPSGLVITFTRTANLPPAPERTWMDTSVPAADLKRTKPDKSLAELKAQFTAESKLPGIRRTKTLSQIGAVGTEDSYAFLMEVAKKTKKPNVRAAAYRALGNASYQVIGEEAVSALAKKARGNNATALAQALHQMGAKGRRAVYRSMLNRSDAGAVSAASRWLAYDADEDTRKNLIRLVKRHSVPATRYAVYTQGLRNLRGGPPVDVMRACLKDDHVPLRAQATQDLATLGKKEALDSALSLAELRPVATQAVNAIARVLGQDGGGPAVTALMDLLGARGFKPNQTRLVLAALRPLRSRVATQAFVAALKHESPIVRATAAEILASIPSREATAALMKRAAREKDPLALSQMLEALGDHGNDVAVPMLLKRAGTGKASEAKFAAVRALGRIGFANPKVRKLLVKFLDSGRDGERMIALDAAGASGDPKLIASIVKSFAHKRWQIRLTAVEALRTLRHKDVMEPLIALLETEEEPRTRDAVAEALFHVTGKPFYDSHKVWRTWYEREGKDFEVPSTIPTRDTSHVGGTGEAGFYGIPIRAGRIVFVIDQSGSMSAQGRATAGEEETPPNRLELARREVVQAISKLKKQAHVNVILFHSTVHPWKKALHRLSSGNRNALKNYLKNKRPGGGTNLYDALEAALQMPHVDSIFLLSDGAPSAGKYVTTTDILRGVRRENQTRRIAIHCVSVGMDSDLLKRLAEEHAGNYVRR